MNPPNPVDTADRSSPTRTGASPVRFWAIGYTLLLLLTGTNIPTPLYQLYQHEFSFSPLVVTLIFAVYVATLIPALLIAGPASDAVGRRPILVPAILLAIVGSVIFATAENLGMLFAARLLQGLAVGAASGALTAALSEAEPRGDRRRAALVATALSVCGLGAGPLLAGWLAQYAPQPLVTPFIVEIALLGPALIAVAALPKPSTRRPWRPRRPSVPPEVRAAFTTNGIAAFLAFSVIGLFLTLVPTYVARLSGSSNLAIQGTAVAGLLACSAVAQVASYGKPPRTLMTVGLCVLPVGLLLLAAARSAESLSLLAVATVLAGIGQGMTFLGALTEVNDLAPPDRHADTVSSFYCVIYLGVGIPVIGVGLLAARLNLEVAVQTFIGVTVTLCIGNLVVSVIRRRGRGTESSARR